MPILGILASAITGNLVVGAYESIATTTLGSTTDSVTFSSIPATFTHLQLRYIARTTRTGDDDGFRIELNGDTTAANYKNHYLGGNGASTYGGNDPEIVVPYIAASGAPANTFGVGVLDLLDYQNTNKYTTVKILGGNDANGVGWVGLDSGLWRNTAAVTSIKIQTNALGDFIQYSQFALYGIKGA